MSCQDLNFNLSGAVIDDISGLKNMGELIYISIFGKPYRVTPDKTFTEKEQQEIKEMYPDCFISCYPVDTNQKQEGER